jgi:hypothetical protein
LLLLLTGLKNILWNLPTLEQSISRINFNILLCTFLYVDYNKQIISTQQQLLLQQFQEKSFVSPILAEEACKYFRFVRILSTYP